VRPFDWDLSVITGDFFGPAIGAGFTISTPVFKLRYSDKHLYRMLSVIVFFCGANLYIKIPLWRDTNES